MHNYFLQSPRLGFRCWRETDLELALGLWGDPAVTRYIASRPYTPDEVQVRLHSEIVTQRRHGIQYWPMFLLSSGEHVGCCGLRPREKEPRTPELGVHVVSRYWRHGYAFESASRVIEYAFSLDGTDALFAGHNPCNAASRGLLTRLGFEYTHEEFYAPTGLRHPSYLLTRQARAGIAAPSRSYDRAL